MKTLIVSFLPYNPLGLVPTDYVPVYKAGRNVAGHTHNILTEVDLEHVLTDPAQHIPADETFIGAVAI